MERVAAELPQMRPEKRTAVVAHDDPGVVDYALPGVDYVLAEKRVLTRPEVGAIAAKRIEKRLPDKKVAARVVVNVAPDATRLVAVTIVARDEQIVVDAPAHAREERVTRRRHTRSADSTNRLVSEIADGIFKPMRIGIGIVVDESDDLALRRLDAEIPFLSWPHLAGWDNGELNILGHGCGVSTERSEPRSGRYAWCARAPVRSIRQHYHLKISIRLLPKRGKTLVEHPAAARAGDHHRDERIVVEFRRHLGLRVVAKDAQAVEDGERVERHCLYRVRLERAELVAEANHYRRLGDLRAALVGDCEKLQVERIRLDEHATERFAEHFAAKELHASLRVGYRKPYKDPDEREVDPAHETAMPRILHDASLVALRADHDVCALLDHRFEEPRRLLRVDVEIAVKQHYVFASRRVEPRPQRGALAAVLLTYDGLYDDMLVLRLGRAGKRRRSAVRRAVVNGNKLRPDSV